MKAGLREQMRARLRTLPAPRWEGAAGKVGRRVCDLPEYRSARTVASYLALAREIPTTPWMGAVRASGKKVVIPAFHGPTGVYAWCAWGEADGDMCKGPHGVMQPCLPLWIDGDTIDLVLVPGLAFDRRGGRLGRGSGFYDRLLRETKRAFKVGLALGEQLLDAVPMEAHDVPMDVVITETETVRCAWNG